VKRLAVAALLLAAAGCGEDGEVAAPVASSPSVVETQPAWRECSDEANGAVRAYRTCIRYPRDLADPAAPLNGVIEVRRDGTWQRLDVELPFPPPSEDTPVVGHWGGVFLSPDGGTLLAQWSAECEVPIAFFVRSSGGRPRPVGRNRYGPAPSTALGWTTDGRAIVDFYEGACGGNEKPGVYLVSVDGRRVIWRPTGTVEPSLDLRRVR
jgi:hypothetical protein